MEKYEEYYDQGVKGGGPVDFGGFQQFSGPPVRLIGRPSITPLTCALERQIAVRDNRAAY